MSNSIDQNKIIEHPVEQSKPAIIGHDEQAVTPKNNAHASVNASSQKQLLVLAKKFSLSAAFLPETKQAPLEERANRRKKLDQLRKQQNMEAIIVRAVQYCSDETITDRADQDWFSSFLTLAESISNKSMQDLWAKILAGEVSQPGSFSLKTLQAVLLKQSCWQKLAVSR
jgi:DMSO/TMAO reductase YedYZ molybdopterin-dependent catalytic subunit